MPHTVLLREILPEIYDYLTN